MRAAREDGKGVQSKLTADVVSFIRVHSCPFAVGFSCLGAGYAALSSSFLFTCIRGSCYFAPIPQLNRGLV